MLDGLQEHLEHIECVPALFRTRELARERVTRLYGYIKRRPDLRAEPHGWLTPRPVRVTVKVEG